LETGPGGGPVSFSWGTNRGKPVVPSLRTGDHSIEGLKLGVELPIRGVAPRRGLTAIILRLE
jgi:hypothetical protein